MNTYDFIDEGTEKYLVNEDFDENDIFVLTEPAILYLTLEDFGIEVGEWKPRLWESIFNAFMGSMVKSGYAKRSSND